MSTEAKPLSSVFSFGPNGPKTDIGISKRFGPLIYNEVVGAGIACLKVPMALSPTHLSYQIKVKRGFRLS